MFGHLETNFSSTPSMAVGEHEARVTGEPNAQDGAKSRSFIFSSNEEDAAAAFAST